MLGCPPPRYNRSYHGTLFTRGLLYFNSTFFFSPPLYSLTRGRQNDVMSAPDPTSLVSVLKECVSRECATDTLRAECAVAFFNTIASILPNLPTLTPTLLAEVQTSLESFVGTDESHLRCVDWQAERDDAYKALFHKVNDLCARWPDTVEVNMEANMNCHKLIGRAVMILLERGAPERCHAQAVAEMLYAKIDFSVDKVVAVLQAAPRPQSTTTTTTPTLSEENVRTATTGMHTFLSLLLTLEQRWPGVVLCDPRLLAKAVIGARLMSPPVLHPGWGITKAWKERNRRFERCLLALFAPSEWTVGAKRRFVAALVDESFGGCEVVSHARLLAVSAVLRTAAVHQKKVCEDATQSPFVDNTAARCDTLTTYIASIYPVYVMNTLASLDASFAWWAPQSEQSASQQQQQQPPLTSVVSVSLSSFVAVAPESCLRFVESALFHALVLPSPLPFIVSAELWAFLRRFSPVEYNESALGTVLHLLVGLSKDVDEKRAALRIRLQHLVRILWSVPAVPSQLAGVLSVHVAPLLNDTNALIKFFTGAPRSLTCFLARHHTQLFEQVITRLADIANSGTLDALPAAASLLKHIRFQPDRSSGWDTATGEVLCLPCNSLYHVQGERQCDCPTFLLTKRSTLFVEVQRLWKVAQQPLNAIKPGEVAPSPMLCAAGFDILGTVLTILKQEIMVKLVALADFVVRRVATPGTPACVVLSGQHLLCRMAIYLPDCAHNIETNVWSKLATPPFTGPHAAALYSLSLANASGYMKTRAVLGMTTAAISDDAKAVIAKVFVKNISNPQTHRLFIR